MKSRNKKHSAVFFDLDGTLFDSWPDIEFVLKNLVLKYSDNKNIAHLSKLKYLNITPELLLKKALNIDKNDVLGNEISEYSKSLYMASKGKYSKLYPGVEALLTNLVDRPTPFGIVTSRDRDFANVFLEKFEFASSLQCCVCKDDVLNPKPASEPLLLACKILDIPPEKCVYIGDSLSDILAGNQAGLTTVGAKYGYGLNELNNIAIGATYTVSNVLELKDLLEHLVGDHPKAGQV